MQDNKYWFFGSKLNSVLLLILIVLVSGAIYIMLQNKETYLNVFQKQAPVATIDKTQPPMQNKDGILGNKDDLISFSILPGDKVSGFGFLPYSGLVKGGYFFEGNILINILDADKKLLKAGNAIASTDWMTTEPVFFVGQIDLSGLPKGSAYVQIHNDNASGLPQNDKFILIPITIE